VIYDAAHSFGVERQDGSVLRHGDLSVLSFHATKVFNTFEGGAIICRDAKTKLRIDQLKNFGSVDETTVVAPGINGKMSEVCAAMGLLQLSHLAEALNRRQQVDASYRAALKSVKGIRCVERGGATKDNFAYFPIMVEGDYGMTRDALFQRLRDRKIFARRYFFPLISEFPMYRGLPSAHRDNLPVATKMASQVLCLPIFPAMSADEQRRVVDAIKGE
jgi:dTDP-4-amino-4,6-dideoxygalactose transaminase